MLAQYAPPSILVNLDDKVVHLSEDAARYLLPGGGELSANAVKLVRVELRAELHALLQAVREKRLPQDSRPIPVRFNGHVKPVVMRVRPSREPEDEGGFTCPECRGPLYENGQKLVEFRCRVGHSMSLRTLLEEHTSTQARKLYEAMVALEEGADLAERVASSGMA